MDNEKFGEDVKRRLTARWEAAESALIAEKALLDAIHREFSEVAASHTEAALNLNLANLKGDGGSLEALTDQVGVELAKADGRWVDLKEQRERVRMATANVEYAKSRCAEPVKGQPPM